MAVMKREWVTEYRGHKVRVVSSWFAGAKLYVDGECKDEERSWIQVDKNHPCLSSRMEMEGGASVLVESYLASSVWLVHHKIHVMSSTDS